jgi:hypothetical protein
MKSLKLVHLLHPIIRVQARHESMATEESAMEETDPVYLALEQALQRNCLPPRPVTAMRLR